MRTTREYAKVRLRAVLHRLNLDLVRNPFPVRVAATLEWLGVETVLDVGANIGQYATGLRSSGFAGDIISCEPLADAYRHLNRRARSDPRWLAVHTAVGADPAVAEINISANSYSSSVLPMRPAHLAAAPDSRVVGVERVEMTTVADLVHQHGISPAQCLLKVDTQGYESEVLDGAGSYLAQFAAVQLELSFVTLYGDQALFDTLVDRLKRLGYTLFGLDAGICDPVSGRLLQCDGLFVETARAEARS